VKLTHYKEKLVTTIQQVQQQSETIQLLVNSELGAEVRSSFNNEIIVLEKRGDEL
jgi:hypothetical protein